MTPREAAIAEAITWLRTPYHHMGRIKGAGVDCAQILIAVYSAAGVIPDEGIDVGFYPHDWHLHRSEERYLRHVLAHSTQSATPRPGDFALFRFGRCVSHSAIIIDWPGTLVHAYVGQGVVYASADDARLRGRLHGFFNPFGD